MERRPGSTREGRSRRGTLLHRAWVVLLGVVCGACGDPQPRVPDEGPVPAAPERLPAIPDSQWVRLVGDLSEPGGYFDTDNLISNETSYLHVLGPMDRLGVRGGAYVGVGPDQSFSYIARQRPRIAFIVDVRRDNLLHHLLLKALFHEADRRVDYLALLFGRAVPEARAAAGTTSPGTNSDGTTSDGATPYGTTARGAAPDPGEAEGGDPWLAAGPESILDALADAPGGPGSPEAEAAWARLQDRIQSFGIPLSGEDRATIQRFHASFVERGGALRFTSHGRRPQPYYPTFAQLLTETDLEGRPGSYLATREAFRFVDALQESNRVIPVVGDLAGPSALRAIGAEVASRGLTVRVLYTSNVEYYLVRDRTFSRFAATLATLPTDPWSVLIRSVFPTAARHPDAVAGYYSTQTLVRLPDVQEALEKGGYANYRDLVTRDAVPLVEPDGGPGSPGLSSPGSDGRRSPSP